MNAFEVSAAKKTLRAFYKKERAAISKDTRAEFDTAICSNLANLSAIKSAATILVYYPVKNEPDILGFIKAMYDIGKRVAFPVSNNDCTLTFRYVERLDDMILGSYDIPEPKEEAEAVTNFSDCVCIVPALVFDKSGYRVGYGKGYYDRFLKNFSGVSIGIAYSSFVVDALPREDTDLCVNAIITERGIICPK